MQCAAEVAAVGYRNAQVAQEPAARVRERAAGGGRVRRNHRYAASGALLNDGNYLSGPGGLVAWIDCCLKGDGLILRHATAAQVAHSQ